MGDNIRNLFTMTAPAPVIIDHCLVTPGYLTLAPPALPRHFGRVLMASIQGLNQVSDPHNTFARLSIVHNLVEIYSMSASFGPNMRTEMCLTGIPQNSSPVLDFPGGLPYQIYIYADVPCRVKLRTQYT